MARAVGQAVAVATRGAGLRASEPCGWRATASFRSRAARSAAAGALGLLVLLATGGCAEISPLAEITDAVLGPAPKSPAASPDPLGVTDPILAYIAEATPNEMGSVPDPVNGHDVWVEAGRRFYAASGHLCRRYRVITPSDPSATRYGLACRDNDGHWYRSRLKVNPLPPSSMRGGGARTGAVRA